MTDQTDVREFLNRMADETGFAPVEPGPVVRKARRRLALTVGGTLLMVGALVAGGMAGVDRLMTEERTQTPAGRRQTGLDGSGQELGPRPRVRGAPPARGVPEVDYVIDLNTDVMTPLPESIIRTAGQTAEAHWPSWLRTPRVCAGLACGDARYAVSPDGSLLAYVGTGDEGTPLDLHRRHRRYRRPPGDARSDGCHNARVVAGRHHDRLYEGFGHPRAAHLGPLRTRCRHGRVHADTDEAGHMDGLQFTPDGASLLYTGGITETTDCSYPGCGDLRTVPIAGGPSTVLFGPGTDVRENLAGAGNGSLSPDGSLVTFTGVRVPADVTRWVANADGTGLRELAGCYDANPAGTWSPDGSRIACQEGYPPTYAVIIVVNVATGDATRAAIGVTATWLDDHTLLVEV